MTSSVRDTSSGGTPLNLRLRLDQGEIAPALDLQLVELLKLVEEDAASRSKAPARVQVMAEVHGALTPTRRWQVRRLLELLGRKRLPGSLVFRTDDIADRVFLIELGEQAQCAVAVEPHAGQLRLTTAW